jgi:RNA polymerase sigma-70 factor (ECF subfamily)
MINGSVGTIALPMIDGATELQLRRAPAFPRRTYGRLVFRQEFDADYIRRLNGGDIATGEHFTSYFEGLLQVKLRRAGWSRADIEDMCQTTFLRVLQTLRADGIENPERIGGYVNAVCTNVMRELSRSHAKHPSVDASRTEPTDKNLNMEGLLIHEDRRKFVQTALQEMPPLEREVLRMVFLEELSRNEICKRMDIGRDYLRVILHRALVHFRALAERAGAARTS